MREIHHFIAGASQAGTSGRFGEVFDPNLGEVQARVALASPQELDAAVQAALAAQVGMAAFADATLAWLENEEPGLAERLDLAEKALRDLL